MAELRTAVAGDTGDYRLIELEGVDDLATIAGVEAHVWNLNTASVTLSASVETVGGSGVTPVIRVELGSWLASTATGGTRYSIEYAVDFGGGIEWTWPQNGDDSIYVRAQGA